MVGAVFFAGTANRRNHGMDSFDCFHRRYVSCLTFVILYWRSIHSQWSLTIKYISVAKNGLVPYWTIILPLAIVSDGSIWIGSLSVSMRLSHEPHSRHLTRYKFYGRVTKKGSNECPSRLNPGKAVALRYLLEPMIQTLPPSTSMNTPISKLQRRNSSQSNNSCNNMSILFINRQ